MSSRWSSLCRDRNGASAVEFALVAPIFLLVLLGIMAYGTVLGTFNGVQQLVAEAARASVGGLSDTERDRLARNFVTSHAASYPFLKTANMTIWTSSTPAPAPSFSVSISYDMSASAIYQLGSLIPLPGPVILRSATVQWGGY